MYKNNRYMGTTSLRLGYFILFLKKIITVRISQKSEKSQNNFNNLEPFFWINTNILIIFIS